jgi:hypothetical protein
MSGVRWSPGASGTAVTFDGTGGYVSCRSGGFPFADEPQTVTWAQLLMAPPKGNAFIVGMTSEKTSLILGLGYKEGKLAVWNTNIVIVQTPPPTLGEWHYIAYTYDQKTHKLYVDGAMKASSTVGTMAGQYRMLELGRWYGGYPTPGASPNQFFQGSVDDVRVYNRALEESEVRDLVRIKKR